MIKRILSGVPLLLLMLCTSLAVTQSVGAAVLWSRGAFTKQKLLGYAAVLYGLDLTELSLEDQQQQELETPEQELTREAILDKRVQQYPLLTERRDAVQRGASDIRITFQDLRAEDERYERLKAQFDDYLEELENAARAASIQEVQRTLEILPTKLSKDLVLRMMDDEGLDQDDDVVQDVVTIFKSMPEDRLKKINSEFKTEKERQQLHRILLEMGEFDTR